MGTYCPTQLTSRWPLGSHGTAPAHCWPTSATLANVEPALGLSWPPNIWKSAWSCSDAHNRSWSPQRRDHIYWISKFTIYFIVTSGTKCLKHHFEKWPLRPRCVQWSACGWTDISMLIYRQQLFCFRCAVYFPLCSCHCACAPSSSV